MSNFRYERWLEKTFSSHVTHQNLDLPPSQLDATKLQRIKRIILIKLALIEMSVKLMLKCDRNVSDIRR